MLLDMAYSKFKLFVWNNKQWKSKVKSFERQKDEWFGTKMTNNFTRKSIKRRGSSGGTCNFFPKGFCLLGPITLSIHIDYSIYQIDNSILPYFNFDIIYFHCFLFDLCYFWDLIDWIERPYNVCVYNAPNGELAFGVSSTFSKIFLPLIFT